MPKANGCKRIRVKRITKEFSKIIISRPPKTIEEQISELSITDVSENIQEKIVKIRQKPVEMSVTSSSESDSEEIISVDKSDSEDKIVRINPSSRIICIHIYPYKDLSRKKYGMIVTSITNQDISTATNIVHSVQKDINGECVTFYFLRSVGKHKWRHRYIDIFHRNRMNVYRDIIEYSDMTDGHVFNCHLDGINMLYIYEVIRDNYMTVAILIASKASKIM